MNALESRLHRTWLSLLIESNYREVAALSIDSEFEFMQGSYQVDGLIVDVSSSTYPIISSDTNIEQIIKQTVCAVAEGRIHDQNGNPIEANNIAVRIRVKLLDVEEDWQEKVKELIANAKDSNQGVVTEKVFSRERKQVYFYNEMKFASKSEIRIAQELEIRRKLFFPLPLAVRSDTGVPYKDHREVDFLICDDGAWGILEVSYHPDRYEKDSEKDTWFKSSGILCVQHYTSERCFNQSAQVVDEFLSILAKHKR